MVLSFGPTKPSLASPAEKKRPLLTAYNLSLSALVASEVVDGYGTNKILNHPKWFCGYNPQDTRGWAISTTDQSRQWTAVDIQNICGPTANFMYDTTQDGNFIERGWTAQWKLAGNRNAAGVIAWNVGADIGQAILAHYLHKKRGWVGMIGTAMNATHAGGHLYGGITNVLFVNRNNNPNSYFRLHNDDPNGSFPQPRWWGKQ